MGSINYIASSHKFHFINKFFVTKYDLYISEYSTRSYLLIKVKLIGVTGIKHNISPVTKYNIKNKINIFSHQTISQNLQYLCAIRLMQDTFLV
jgi:phage-related protein